MINNYNEDYELEIVYCKKSNLDANGNELIPVEYSIEIYDNTDNTNSTINGFNDFEDMRTYLNEENLFYQLDNDDMIIKFDNIDDAEIGDELNIVKFSKVLFNGKLIERKQKHIKGRVNNEYRS